MLFSRDFGVAPRKDDTDQIGRFWRHTRHDTRSRIGTHTTQEPGSELWVHLLEQGRSLLRFHTCIDVGQLCQVVFRGGLRQRNGIPELLFCCLQLRQLVSNFLFGDFYGLHVHRDGAFSLDHPSFALQQRFNQAVDVSLCDHSGAIRRLYRHSFSLRNC